jgi:3'-phosphoadenosine 5'-phosphosulfate sulfotransferase (PAPS reductase)/FAD synthetase
VNTVNHIGISGGKDSTALLLWAVHESGYPLDSLDVSFCDTGNEAPETYDYIRYLSETVFPIHWLIPKRTFYELAAHKKMFPNAVSRFCTEELKIKPTAKHIEYYAVWGIDVVLHNGIRRGESHARKYMLERDEQMFWNKEYKVRRPLIDWTLEDVWDMHDKYGIKRNPLYALGASRVGCRPCIMSNQKELGEMARRTPQAFDELAEREADVNRRINRELTWLPFFPTLKIPLKYHTKEYVNRKGQRSSAPCVEDVRRWALERTLSTPSLFEGMDEIVLSCSAKTGLCE